jgi:molecular chaperone Hsp33
MLVVDFTTPDKVRACARFDKTASRGDCGGRAERGALLGRGHLAMTIDQGGNTSRYQGLVALEGGTLEGCGARIFPALRADSNARALAVAEEFRPHRRRDASLARRRMLLQFVPRAPERARVADLDPVMRRKVPSVTRPRGRRLGRGPLAGRDRAGRRADRSALSSERLLYRLFHERGVRVFRSADCMRSARARAKRRGDAAFVPADRPRRHGRERQDLGHLRILQRDYVFEPADVADPKIN